MARALWWALLLCWAAEAEARYADYSGGRMPQYGGGADYEGPRDLAAGPPEDYVDPPPDSTASPSDYKYDDDTGKTERPAAAADSGEWRNISKKQKRPPKTLDENIEDPGDWRNNSEKQKRLSKATDVDSLEHIDKYIPEETLPKFKMGPKFSKHRPRIPARISNDEGTMQRPMKYGRKRLEDGDSDLKDDIHIHHEDLSEKGLVLDDSMDTRHDIHIHHREPKRKKGLAFDEDNVEKEFVQKATTMRVARRKPRDRFIKRVTPGEDEEEDLWRKHMMAVNRKNLDYYQLGAGKPQESGRRQFHDENEKIKLPGGRRFDDDLRYDHTDGDRVVSNPRNMIEPSDEEDSLRVIGKQKENRKLDDYKDYSYDMKRVEGIRNNLPALLRRPTTARTASEKTEKKKDFQDMLANRRVLVPLPTNAASTSTIAPTHINTTPRIVSTTSATKILTTPMPLIVLPSTDFSEVLSLAEKSRLSILKKSQKKDSEKEVATKKPPVLMQVTRQMHTLVMVEPPSSLQPWMRAKVVSDDSPDNLKQVKRLMRHKLVQNAKSIHDLTENWDEMICDYVDTELLRSSGNTSFISLFLLMLTLFICKYLRFIC